MLKIRIATAVVGIPLILAVLYIGGIYWQIFFSLLAILALYEYLSMLKEKEMVPLLVPSYYLMFILFYRAQLSDSLALLFFAGLILLVLEAVLRYPKVHIDDIAVTVFGAVYIGFLFSYAVLMLELDNAFYFMLFAFLLTWSSDIGGYLFGSLWGKHKMAPRLSPKKSWEGAFGGVLLTIVISIIFEQILGQAALTLLKAVFLGLAGSLAAQFGDLFMSGIKRYFEVKDSGNIIPGHGGVLDRFDSFMLVVPVVYYLALFLV